MIVSRTRAYIRHKSLLVGRKINACTDWVLKTQPNLVFSGQKTQACLGEATEEEKLKTGNAIGCVSSARWMAKLRALAKAEPFLPMIPDSILTSDEKKGMKYINE